MATWALEFDCAPDTNTQGHTTTLRFWCCGEQIGDVTSGPANHATITNWQARSISLTAHMANQPKADHYPFWRYLSGNDASRVRNLKITNSDGGSWWDQYGGDGGHPNNGHGIDGGSTASQYDVGSYTTALASGSSVDHLIEGIDMGADWPALRLEFEQRPDSGQPETDDSTSTITCEVKETSASAYVGIGTRTSDYAGAFWKRVHGGDPWASRSFVISTADLYEMRWSYSTGNDASSIRNVRLIRADGSQLGDQFLRRPENGWNPDVITGADGSGAAQQPDPSQTAPGTFANTVDGWCHHYFAAPSYDSGSRWLRFDLAPNAVATGGSGHRTRISCYFNGVYKGDVVSLAEAGNDGVYEWATFELDVTDQWIGDGSDVFSWRYYALTTTPPYNDSGSIRNVRVEDAAGPSIVEADQFYPLWHGDVAPAAVSGADSSGTANRGAIADVCTYEMPATSTAVDPIYHYFPGNRCVQRSPVVGFIGWR